MCSEGTAVSRDVQLKLSVHQAANRRGGFQTWGHVATEFDMLDTWFGALFLCFQAFSVCGCMLRFGLYCMDHVVRTQQLCLQIFEVVVL